jgi:shikimate dehydrogenase
VAVIRLIGRHISYSASPAMQQAALAALGLRHRYELADVDARSLPDTVAGLRATDALGANVTVPHKAAVMALLDEIEPLAARTGAVNTIVRRGGHLVGSNTDVPAIAEQVGLLRPRARQAVVLGAGGAARAVVEALAQAGARAVTLVARTPHAGVEPWSRLPGLLRGADLLVNATPVGAASDETPLPGVLLRPDLAVLDLVYRPSPTRLVREARAVGAPARAGAGVLLGQGWRSLSAWLGTAVQRDVVDVMAGALRRELGEAADV